MELTKLYEKYCIDFNQNFYTLTKAELDSIKASLTPEQLKEMEAIVDEIFTYELQSVTFNRPAFVNHLEPNQYFSLSSYFYPDETDPSKPWLRRDGQVNPESIMYAKQALRKTSMVINLSSLMLYLTGEQKYRDLLEAHIEHFFNRHNTAMLPNLNYAQMVMNHPRWLHGRGFGIMDFSSNMGYGFVMIKHLHDAGMIDEEVYEDLRRWTNKLINWLELSPVANEERNAPNNHGVLYTLLLTQLYFFVGELDEHRDNLLDEINSRLVQIEDDGSLPEELLRTRALAYSTMAIKAFIDTYKLLEEDFTQIVALRKSLEFLLPVLSNQIAIEDIDIEDDGVIRGCVQIEGTYPEYYKLYVAHLARYFGIDFDVQSDEDVHYKYMFTKA